MKHYLLKLWKTKASFITLLFCVLIMWSARYLSEWRLPTQGQIGFLLGLVVALIFNNGPHRICRYEKYQNRKAESALCRKTLVGNRDSLFGDNGSILVRACGHTERYALCWFRI